MPFTPTRPRILPPLDKTFQPISLLRRDYKRLLTDQSTQLVIGLRRNDESFSRIELQTLPEQHPEFAVTLPYIERMVKFLLWQRGGYELYVAGCSVVASHLRSLYSMGGPRAFDVEFIEKKSYRKPFKVIECERHEVPQNSETGQDIGRHLEGARIGFDLGASDRKVSAVIDGKVVYSEEVVWEPKLHSDPDYHYRQILNAISSGASHLPRVDAIGGSSAGIYLNNEPRVASLFRAVPDDRYEELRTMFHRIQKRFGVPLVVINDGDVTALAGSMSLEENSVLGIALGSSLAAGYVNAEGKVMGWLNELAFAPVDLQTDTPVEEWSGDVGCGANYFSQQCVFRLAPAAEIELPTGVPDASKLASVQEKLEAGHKGATQIWETMGTYLGYTIPLYTEFYDIKHLLILGRCTSGRGGEILIRKAHEVLRAEFPNLVNSVQLHLPDENIRRVGQSVAAASLPVMS